MPFHDWFDPIEVEEIEEEEYESIFDLMEEE